MPNHRLPIMPGEPLSVSETERDHLGKLLVEHIEDLEAEHSTYFDDIKLWWQWYNAVPAQATRTDPWNGASNIVVPLIRYHSDALSARISNTIFATDDLCIARTWNEESYQVGLETAQFLNWANNDNDCDLKTPATAWHQELTVVGESVLMLNWERKTQSLFTPGEGGRPRAVERTIRQGPTLTRIPRERIMWQSDRSIDESEYVVVRSLHTRADMARMAQAGDVWEKQLDHIAVSHDYGTTTQDLYDIRQVWVDMPVLAGMTFQELDGHDWDTPLIPLLVTLDRTSGTVLMVKGKPYLTRSWPFYTGQFRSVAGAPQAVGLSCMLEHIQRGATVIVNQAIDSNTLSNSIQYATSDPKMLTRRFVPGLPLYVEGGLDNFTPVPRGSNVVPDMTLMNSLGALAERLTGINDPALGRETRSGGHPSPATSTALMLQESKEMLSSTIRGLRLQYSRILEDQVTLYQQYEIGDTGRIERAIGTRDAAQVRSWLMPDGPTAGQITFDLKAMDENANQDTAIKKAMAVLQMTQNYGGYVMNLLNVGSQPMTPPAVKLAIPVLLESVTEATKQVLEAAQTDDIEKFLFSLKDTPIGNPALLGQAQAIAASGAANAASQQPPAGGPAGPMGPGAGDPSAPPVPPGAGGVPMAPNGAAPQGV